MSLYHVFFIFLITGGTIPVTLEITEPYTQQKLKVSMDEYIDLIEDVCDNDSYSQTIESSVPLNRFSLAFWRARNSGRWLRFRGCCRFLRNQTYS